jgi:IS30 family transposase
MTLNSKQIQQIEDMHKKGANITKVAKTINVSRDTIYKYLQERYPEQFREVDNQTQKSQNQVQIKIQSQQPAQPQTQPVIITLKKVYTPTLVSVEEQ